RRDAQIHDRGAVGSEGEQFRLETSQPKQVRKTLSGLQAIDDDECAAHRSASDGRPSCLLHLTCRRPWRSQETTAAVASICHAIRNAFAPIRNWFSSGGSDCHVVEFQVDRPKSQRMRAHAADRNSHAPVMLTESFGVFFFLTGGDRKKTNAVVRRPSELT